LGVLGIVLLERDEDWRVWFLLQPLDAPHKRLHFTQGICQHAAHLLLMLIGRVGSHHTDTRRRKDDADRHCDGLFCVDGGAHDNELLLDQRVEHHAHRLGYVLNLLSV